MSLALSQPDESSAAQKAFVTPIIIDNIVDYCNNGSLAPLCRVNQVCFDVITTRIYRSMYSNTRNMEREQPPMGFLYSDSNIDDRDSLRQALRSKIHHISIELNRYQRYSDPPSEPITARFPNLKVLQLRRQTVHPFDIVPTFIYPKVDTLIMDSDPYESDYLIDYIRRSIPLIESSASEVVIRWFRRHRGSANGPLIHITSDFQPAIHIVWILNRADLYFIDMMYEIYGCLKRYGGTIHLYVSQAVGKTILLALKGLVDSKQTFISGEIDRIVARDFDPVMAKMLLLRLEGSMDHFGHDEAERRAMFSKLRLIGDAEIDTKDWHKQFCRDWKYLVEVQKECYRNAEYRGIWGMH